MYGLYSRAANDGAQPRTSSCMSVLSKPHFRNRSGYELSKLSMHFFKLEPKILICLPLVNQLISGSSLSSLTLLCKHHARVINATLQIELFRALGIILLFLDYNIIFHSQDLLSRDVLLI